MAWFLVLFLLILEVYRMYFLSDDTVLTRDTLCIGSDQHLLRKLHDDCLGSLVKLVLGVLLLLLQRGHDIGVGTLLPIVETVDLTTSNQGVVRKQDEEGGGGERRTYLMTMRNGGKRTLLRATMKGHFFSFSRLMDSSV